MPIFLWCIDLTIGLRLGFLLLISGNLNTVLKLAFHGPRPYWVDTNVKAYTTETSFGISSGHAQISTGVWGRLAYSFKERWLWIITVLGGFFNRTFAPVQRRPLPIRCAGWLGHRRSSFVTLRQAGKTGLNLGSWTLPQVWVTNAAAAAPGSAPIAPLSLSDIFSDAGGLLGLAAGAVFLPFWGGFNAGGPILKRILRFLVGVIGVLAFWRGPALVFPGGEDLLGLSLRYLRYALTGFWMSGLAPVLFTRFRLAEKNS